MRDTLVAPKGVEQYRRRTHERLSGLREVFARAAVGDFSEEVEIPAEDDEFAELYMGVNIMLDVIKRELAREQSINRAKSDFLALASHQLRTPLTLGKWYVEALTQLLPADFDSEGREYVRNLHHAIARMIALTDMLLNVSRLELGTLAIQPEEADVAAAMRSAASQAAHASAAKGISFTESYPAERIYAHIDTTALHMILENLLSNAVKYTPAGGSVSLALEAALQSLTFRIADTGYGIPRDSHKDVFTKLFRAKNTRALDPDGSGFGLSIVKSLVERAGGDIAFESTEGKGTSFTITFPRSGMKAGTHGAHAPQF